VDVPEWGWSRIGEWRRSAALSARAGKKGEMLMTSVVEHYEKHLGPIYTWMVGGVENAIERGAAEIETLHASPQAGNVAVDLGAGFGMHAIPLARRGFSVVAVDTCAGLLEELCRRRDTLPIRTIRDDLLLFRKHLATEAQLVLCMGDTLTHLADFESVVRLIAAVAETLRPGGRFVTTFRDYSKTLTDEQRFIPVRSDDRRILTCFLEYASSHVRVHDILHERGPSGWQMRVGSYRKLRVVPDWICNVLKSSGFDVRREAGMDGMVRLVATRV
jgi:SAM-dependent methyltransferase